MEHVVLTFASYRLAIAILLAVGGMICIWFGYRLFSQAAGLYKSVDKLAIKHRDFSVSVTGMSTGGFLMLTSAVWAYYAYSSVPHLEANSDGSTKVVGGPPYRIAGYVGGHGYGYGPQETDFIGQDVFTSDGYNIGELNSFVFDEERKKWQAQIYVRRYALDAQSGSIAVDLDMLKTDPLVISLSEGDVKAQLSSKPKEGGK